MLIIVYGRSVAVMVPSPYLTPALCQFDLNRMNPDYAERDPLENGQREGKGGGQQVALFCVGNAHSHSS